MARDVLITGATGTLGHRVVGEATEAGHKVRALSRRHHVGYTGVHWAQGDLLSGEGIDAALDGIDTVIHCATQGTRAKDVVSATNLISAARRAKTANIIYVSIVGIDRIPLPYYKTKLRVEEALAASGLGHTIVRVTQFHDLIETSFSMQRFTPALIAIKDVRFQPIDTRDVASHLVSLIDKEAAGRVDDIGGPAVFGHDDLGRMYVTSRGSRRRVVSLPVPGGIVAGFKSGANLVPANPIGTIGFAEYLVATT
ncbi:SDR family oxidoreductase [Mycobacterium sp. ITM-2016-00318]|uniref:SDR family oxidoreductase n=1 Tax=Mycobacterium sp. ITM-2016-00318 TaxID=2099693 RepID=UPI000CF8620C|nr:NAD(P)H-binding protein [Mycobacterium sp. ITM-2016-00318]WNG92024.1 NAD(P)H-binding protein [Mycobacterium sp. ITM-2016-00318]